MKRIHIHITDKQLDLLRKARDADGRPVAELVRWAIDYYLKRRTHTWRYRPQPRNRDGKGK